MHVDVEPRGIFTTLIPTQVLLQPGSTPGAVPDAAIDVAMAAPATARNATAGSRLPMQRWLFDVKTIFGGNGLYQCPRARDEQSGAVAERAHRCAGEYLSAARAADRQYSAPGTNPILDRLRSFGQTRGLAFGAYGEASPDVHALLTVAADGLAARQWRDIGGAHAGGGALVHRLLAAPAAGPRHLPRVRTPPHPPGAVHRRAAGRRRAAHAARPAHRRTAGASAALRAVRRLLPVPGRRGTAGRPRVSAHGRRACRKAGAKRGPRRDGATRLIESRIVLELQSATRHPFRIPDL